MRVRDIIVIPTSISDVSAIEIIITHTTHQKYYQISFPINLVTTRHSQYVAPNLFNCLIPFSKIPKNNAPTTPVFTHLDVVPNTDYQLIDKHNMENHFFTGLLERAVN
ncbi:unnamed protein product [Rotaria sp. Silwood1]|nr:unnamed protein product [Rotaria sp. Silwood1]CAF4671089.1 unnamed protein product [Rotaria sp. Silwood1]CAF4920626.1 unnamed protein product [Rotaria sp. Silwood1]